MGHSSPSTNTDIPVHTSTIEAVITVLHRTKFIPPHTPSTSSPKRPPTLADLSASMMHPITRFERGQKLKKKRPGTDNIHLQLPPPSNGSDLLGNVRHDIPGRSHPIPNSQPTQASSRRMSQTRPTLTRGS